MVVWIIGMSASGKTTIAGQVVGRIRQSNQKVVLLDGDALRALFRNDVDHSLEGRRRNAERLSRLSKFLDDQGIHVVAAVLSIFPEWRLWNRRNIPDYAEVYVRASMQTLLRRDRKNLYARALKGEISNVVGVDLPFPEPEKPELVIDNDADLPELKELADKVMEIEIVRKVLGQA